MKMASTETEKQLDYLGSEAEAGPRATAQPMDQSSSSENTEVEAEKEKDMNANDKPLGGEDPVQEEGRKEEQAEKPARSKSTNALLMFALCVRSRVSRPVSYSRC